MQIEAAPHPVYDVIREGTVIPAHPLALDARRTLDPVRQRALTRYYLDSGAGGLAVGVHTTQFAIRAHGLYEPVLRLAAESARDWTSRPVALIAGVTGLTPQAVGEATVARELGYHAALVNVAAFRGRPEKEILEHCRELAEIIPLVGFSLLPACGGLHLSYEFWREFAELDNVIAIKIATFDRYRTLDIARAVVDAGAEGRIALYTGNDDHVVLDLVTPMVFRRDGVDVTVRMRGGLLGHWCVWTRRAVQLLERIKGLGDESVPADLLGLDARVTDSNLAIYDGRNDLRGSVPGVLEVLRRQGLVEGTWCLDPEERLSEGQSAEIDRVHSAYPELNDDAFVAEHLARWLDEERTPLEGHDV